MKLLYLFIASILLSCNVFAQSYTSIESVEYDPDENRFLVSNGNSIISRASDGSLSFFGDARANYGMEVMNGVLFGIYNSSVRAYDLSTAELLSTLNISGASFLNGMASDGVSRLWVTDFGNGEIHEIDATDPSSMSFETVADITGSPNGISYDSANDRCLIVMWGNGATVREMDLTTYNVSTLVNTGLSNIDGIDSDDYGNWFLSSWTPQRITKYNSDFSEAETVTVADGLSNPADICYANAIDTLAIPNSSNNTVVFVGFLNTSSEEIEKDSFEVLVFPNPSKNHIEIRYSLAESADIELDIYDLNGKHMANLVNHRQVIGIQRVIADVSDYPRGNYLTSLRIGNRTYIARFVLN